MGQAEDRDGEKPRQTDKQKKLGFWRRTGHSFLRVISWKQIATILKGLARPFQMLPPLWTHYRSLFVSHDRMQGTGTQSDTHQAMLKSRMAAGINLTFAVLAFAASFWAANLYALIACLAVGLLFVFQTITNIYIYMACKDKLDD